MTRSRGPINAPSTGPEFQRRDRESAFASGAARVETWLFKGARQSFAWVDEAIDERIRSTAAAPVPIVQSAA